MYTRSFYETAAGRPQPELPPDFSPHKLPVEYMPTTFLFKVGSIGSFKGLNRNDDDDDVIINGGYDRDFDYNSYILTW